MAAALVRGHTRTHTDAPRSLPTKLTGPTHPPHPQQQQHEEELAVWLFDERRPVTARYLSLVLSLPPHAARRLLAAFYRRHRAAGGAAGKKEQGLLKATFLVMGEGKGGREVLLLPEERVAGTFPCVCGGGGGGTYAAASAHAHATPSTP